MNVPKKKKNYREKKTISGLRTEELQQLTIRWERMSLQKKLRKYQQKDEEKLEKFNDT